MWYPIEFIGNLNIYIGYCDSFLAKKVISYNKILRLQKATSRLGRMVCYGCCSLINFYVHTDAIFCCNIGFWRWDINLPLSARIGNISFQGFMCVNPKSTILSFMLDSPFVLLLCNFAEDGRMLVLFPSNLIFLVSPTSLHNSRFNL